MTRPVVKLDDKSQLSLRIDAGLERPAPGDQDLTSAQGYITLIVSDRKLSTGANREQTPSTGVDNKVTTLTTA